MTTSISFFAALNSGISRKDQMTETERRQSQRFPLQHPAVVRRTNGGTRELLAITENACMAGTYLQADTTVPEGSQVEVTLLLKTENSANIIRLYGAGRVLRVEQKAAGSFGIAIAYDQPLTQAWRTPASVLPVVKEII